MKPRFGRMPMPDAQLAEAQYEHLLVVALGGRMALAAAEHLPCPGLRVAGAAGVAAGEAARDMAETVCDLATRSCS